MAADIQPSVTITEAEGQRVVVCLAGELEAHMALELEERFADPRMLQAREWVLDMEAVIWLDLTCAYALFRAATSAPEPIALHIHGARRSVQHILRDAGVDAIATVNE
ncbi:STAS domain-containing protein [Streptomyces sp. A7024]|uniref:STAS domain-containing protein n=1 Tax=Streptomyces coryli TaxID=1128680 RepID=A0A6G4U3B3_9ACTN|nr:STAS domain-containing protein [Streptomyces coryli]NGN65721.1 STAS domain-containing protein [Streptomyces coryli]